MTKCQVFGHLLDDNRKKTRGLRILSTNKCFHNKQKNGTKSQTKDTAKRQAGIWW